MTDKALALTEEERAFARPVADLCYCNPFLPERIDLEQVALGDEFEPWSPVLSKQVEFYEPKRNVFRIAERGGELVASLARRGAQVRGTLEGEDARLIEDVALFVLFHRYIDRLDDAIRKSLSGRGDGGVEVDFYNEFRRELFEMLKPVGDSPSKGLPPAHVFALVFQLRRAFHHIFEAIIGRSMPAARLRAAVWESIFTRDLRRYSRGLYDRMSGLPCLVTGPSGTGKELVARAVGLSRYVAFDGKKRAFLEDFGSGFHALNLSALSPTLVESELFGHRRHSFTGALEDRAGWLEACSACGAVFLDEIGDVSPEIQVKLLRVLETRTFQRIGDTGDRSFEGKIIAATNRDLSVEIREGRFREDLYYRLCADRIATPSLRDHLDDDPEAIRDMLFHVAERVAGADEAPAVAEEAARYIRTELGSDYSWPGNFRELEQCVRNILIRGAYRPLEGATGGEPLKAWLGEIVRGRPTAEELLSRYCTLVYRETGTYQETARRLGIDHRTVKSRIDWKWLGQLGD